MFTLSKGNLQLQLKKEIDKIIEKLKIQPIGNGYIDCICPMENAITFIDSMTRLNINITEFTWWCFVDDKHEPCGMGGPKNKYGNGWYSEVCMDKIFQFSSNDEIKRYLLYEWNNSDIYKSCFVPAFWLDIPDE